MSFDSPQNLSLAIIFILLFFILSITNFIKKPRQKTQVILRFLAILSLCLVILNPYLEKTSTKFRATLLLDISDSMNQSVSDELLNQVRNISGSDLELSLYPFAGKSSVVASDFSTVSNTRKLKETWSSLNIGETNLEEAVSKAASLDPENILLISDAFETKGNVEQISSLLKGKKKIFPLIPNVDTDLTSAFEISKLHAPLVAPSEKSVEIRASIKNDTKSIQSGLLEIKHGSKVIQKRTISVNAGGEFLIKAESDRFKEGTQEVVATFTPVDPRISPSIKTLYISGESREKILIISSNEQDEFLLKQALSGQSYRVVTLTNPSVNTTSPDLQGVSAVLLNNINFRQLPTKFPIELEAFVKSGGGAVMVGGNQSFGLGGYLATTIEDLLPVEMLPPQTIKKRLNVAVSLVLDKSRSMASDDKIYYAKEAAAAVIKSLKDEDLIEVIGFDSSPFVVTKLAPLSQVRSSALERITRLFPAGRTNLLPALHEARRSFSKVEAGRKHMIILTDGKIPDAGDYYMELVNMLKAEGVTVSTVMLGDEIDPGLLKDIAIRGGGSFHQTTNATSLARIFLDDIKVSTGENTLKESQEFAVKKGTGSIVSTSITSFPPLRGYVQTKVKEKANLELIAYDGTRAEPLLASWDYGQGRSIAFTSDANGRWSSFWADWSKFTNFWIDIVDALKPKSSVKDENIKFDLRYFVERGVLNLDLAIYSENVSGAVIAILKTPEQKDRPISFEEFSNGRFKAQVSDVIAGKYEFKAKISGKGLTPISFYLSGDLFGEKTGRGFNKVLLTNLANSTAGVINPSAQDLRSVGNKEIKKTYLTYPLLGLAVVLLLLEILLREAGDLFSRIRIKA
ncbi:MAG: glutamine amidotransferase [bacterium]|nr:glutamine amidotransferase [bacterium]